MTTYRPSCASTATVINTDSVATVGEAMSYFFIVSRCFMLSVHARTFMYLFQFYLGTSVMPTPPLSVSYLVWLFPLMQGFLGRAAMLVPL